MLVALKLNESFFKEILLRDSYILVFPRGYHILLMSSCPMNKVLVGKLPVIASYTFNFISKLLQGKNNMLVFCSTVQRLPLIVLCWKYQLWIDVKIESVLLLALHEK